ncbi:hypothetical protein Pse7367_2241 [Thalassoporum mexicanum PCC 7367]|uniref:FxLYD domain-containing protein n=1 Tax=Thalassoporum mexicanum TaxID=3457544 RepID=UPI00029FB767|nr:FxLYD domain-containing protein [Pseudanabaena sp. PCC 7367]AFY70504.1 hypothetical protein Pse7367_2241 [Pseudanabaena sp. PCC 7367]
MRYKITLLASIGIALAAMVGMPKPAAANLLSVALCSQEWETAIGIAQTYAKDTNDPQIQALWLEYADRLSQVAAGTLSFDPAELDQLGCNNSTQAAPSPAAPVTNQPSQPEQAPPAPVANNDDDDDDEEEVEPPKVALVSSNYLNGTFVGRVINNGSTPVRFVRVNYQIVDQNGSVIRESFAVASPTVLSPGQAGQFLSFVNQPGQNIEIRPGQVEWTE